MTSTRRLLIDNAWVDSPDRQGVFNPFTGGKICDVPLGNAATLDAALVSAHRAFDATRKLPAFERAEVLRRISMGIEKRRRDFVDTIVAEAGKPVSLAEVEVSRAVGTFQIAADESKRVMGELFSADAIPAGANHVGSWRRFPTGVIVGITPFNFPLNLVAHKVAPAIATGNTIVIKPAPKTPLTSLLLGEVLVEAGIIPGQVNIVTCPNEIVHQLSEDDRVKHISFTGSATVGWKIKEKSGKKKLTLELGGNAAVVVHADADLDKAIPAIATGAFAYAGQSCISVQRVYLHESIAKQFTERFVQHVKDKVVTGDPTRKDVLVGPMIDAGALARVMTWIDRARTGGANVLTGAQTEGPCLLPTVLSNVDPASEVCVEEVFAPVVVLDTYRTFDEAIQKVNASKFGLHAGVYTHDIRLAMRAYDELDVGGVLINQTPTYRLDHAPYGGSKDSGMGREGVRFAMEDMTEIKTLLMNLG